MEEMKFEELTELKEPERLLESAMPFQKLIMQYQCALLEVKTKFEVLNHELSINSDQNPILSIESRIKKPISILEKMKRKNIEISVQAIEENICDIAGIRVICCFPKDIYTLAKKICEQDDIRQIMCMSLKNWRLWQERSCTESEIILTNFRSFIQTGAMNH